MFNGSLFFQYEDFWAMDFKSGGSFVARKAAMQARFPFAGKGSDCLCYARVPLAFLNSPKNLLTFSHRRFKSSCCRHSLGIYRRASTLAVDTARVSSNAPKSSNPELFYLLRILQAQDRRLCLKFFLFSLFKIGNYDLAASNFPEAQS